MRPPPAVAQAALLEAYGGPAVAAEAAMLADALRAGEPPPAHAAASPTRTGRPRRGRRNRTPVESSARRGGGDSSDAASAAPTAACLAQPARRPASPPTLEALDAVDLLAELRGPVPTLQDVPVFLRGGLRRALEFALTALRAASAGPAEEAVRARAWKLFLLTPRMLLARTAETGAAGSRELLARVGAYERAEWPALLERARAQHRPARGASNIADAKAAAAHRRARSLRACKRGSAPGLSGARAEHYKVLLDQADALELLAEAATLLARADVPQEVAAGIALARMTAIQKPGGGVRGIATGDTFRRLVSRTLAASHAATFDEATRPFQHALSTRAGMDDALTAKLRAALERDPQTTVVSLDGRSAYDCISRAAFLHKLHEVAPALVPFARLFYGQASEYLWWDESGERHSIFQGEGCEHPALFALGQHAGLQHAAERLQDGEELLAFLDDLYLVLPCPTRSRAAFDTATASVEAHTGIAANLGKTRVFNFSGGPAPPGVRDLGDDVWRGDKPLLERGIVALGCPVGTPQFIEAWGRDRVAKEDELLRQLPLLPDLQCAWLLLAYCASPRANHALRTVPPELIRPYAAAHDAAVWGTLQACAGEPAEDAECPARAIALLPASLGGLGLTQATRAAPAAYWAAWADSLAVFEARCPRFAAWAVAALQDGTGPACQRAAEAGRQLLLNEGWVDVPTWSRVARGARPPGPEPDATEPGGRVHGWQFHASRTRNRFFRDRVLLPSLSPAHRALVRSQAGPHAGAWLTAIPSDPHTTLSPEMMQIALRRRLRLPLPLAAGRCGGDGGQSTPGCGRLFQGTATMPWLAPARACLRAVPKSSSAPARGCRAKWCRSNGWPIPPRLEYLGGTVAAWTSSSTGRPRWEGRYAATTPHSSRRWRGTARPTAEPQAVTGRAAHGRAA